MISEGSECNIIQKSFDLKEDKTKFKNSSTIINNDHRMNLSELNDDHSKNVKKINTLNSTQVNFKAMIKNKELKSKKINNNNSKRDYKRNSLTNNKVLKHNTFFKSVREKLKESIILRPEDLQSIKKNRNIKNKKFSNGKISSKPETSSKNKIGGLINRTDIRNIRMRNLNKKINTFNLGYINKNEIYKKNNSDIIKKDLNIFHISEGNENKNEENKIIKNEIESQETLKGNETNNNHKVKLFKKATFNTSNNIIQRKNTMYFDKFRSINRKPIIYDSLDDEEIEDEEDDGRRIYLDPNSNFVLFFDGILFIFTFVSFIEIPFYLSMTHDFCRNKKMTLLAGFNIINELLNICDCFLGFFRAYYNWEEQLILSKRSIIKKYLSEWFIFDLISSFPIYIINKLKEPLCNETQFSTHYYNVVLNNLKYFLNINKLLKLIKVISNNQAYKMFSNKINEKLQIFFYSLLVIFALNYSACLYIFIARNSYPNWILKTGLGTHSFIHIYICSIYILIMALTTVGYGDITCYSFNEIVYQLFLLIVGIMAYSYAVSLVSNYFQKIGEKSADFTKKKSILNEIRLSNPNIPEELYERILRFLYYKHKHEKKIKNLIFDCLPISLKNDLISEMYKPIITNFIFFKNFQNKDFIVRVILSFKAVIAFKNDILVNEGDLLEEIMFVKKGVLSVELPINLTNPQKNIDKYIKKPLLNLENKKNIINVKEINKSNKRNKNKAYNTTIFASNFEGSKIYSSTIDFKTVKEKEKIIEEEEIKYVRILGIRNNEHFGDVLMFLEKRSPLRLRVSSKKCELFFLKKLDAIKISNSHPTIWRNINKKSIYNFEQIKKCIIRIVEIYCEIKRDKSISQSSSELISLNTNQKEKNSLDNSILSSNKSNYKNRSQSFNFVNNSIFGNNEEYIELEKNKYKSSKSLEKTSKFYNDFSKNNILNFDPSPNPEKQLIGNSKFQNISKNNQKIKTTEKNEKEGSIIEKQNDKNFIKKIRTINSLIKNDIDINYNNLINEINLSSSKTLKIDESYTYSRFFNDQSSEFEEENELNNISQRIVNKEINSEEDFRLKKYSNSLFDKKYNIIPKNQINKEINNIEFKNSKAKKLLNSFVKVQNVINAKECKNKENFPEIICEHKNNINKNPINQSNVSSITIHNEKESKYKSFGTNQLSINNNISLFYKSSYENCNLIAMENLIKNKALQEKLKNFLKIQIEDLSCFNNGPYFNSIKLNKKNNSLTESNKEISKQNFPSIVCQNNKKGNLIENNFNNYSSKKSNKINFRKSASLLNTKNSFVFMKKTIVRSSSFNENYNQKNQINKIKFNYDFNDNKNNTSSPKKSSLKRPFTSQKEVNSFIRSNDRNEFAPKKFIKKKSTMYFSPNIKIKRNHFSNNLLSQIDLNIEKTNQNLNNPDEFYSNYFSYLLEEKIKGRKSKINYSNFFAPPKNENSEPKKEKISKRMSASRKVSE